MAVKRQRDPTLLLNFEGNTEHYNPHLRQNIEMHHFHFNKRIAKNSVKVEDIYFFGWVTSLQTWHIVSR